jgi:large subunit ribosomal protein L10
MDRTEKADVISGLAKTLAETSVIVVTRNHGLTVAQVTDLRNKMRAAGASFKVTKNRLARIALEGTPYQPIGDLLTGPTAFATSADPVAAAKIAVEFAKTTDKFEIVGGAIGAQLLDINGIKALAELPSLDELRARIIGVINAPATKLAQLANAPAAKLARVFAAYADKDGSGDTPAEAEAA